MQRTRLAAIAMLAALAVSAPASLEAQSRRWGEGYMPNLPVVTQDGKTLRFYDDVIKGKIVVINFIYTNCPDICGLTTARLSQVEEKLGYTVGRDIFFVSLTVDPENDTPAKLKEYADAFHAGPGWLFLTGKPEDIRAINFKLGERSKDLREHRQEVVLGNDAIGLWARNSVLGDLERFVMDVRGMDPKWREQVRVVERNAAMDTGYQLGTQPGQVLFTKLCAPCHTIGVGDRAGPDLRGVTARRDHDWLMNFIMDPYKMRAQNDPLAIELSAKYPGVLMPRLGLAEVDANDLITYLETQSARLKAEPDPAQAANADIGGAFKLIDHHGEAVTDRDYRGKPTLVFFGFTFCPEICPTTLFELSNRLAELKSDGDRLNVLFITVDPDRDTPQQLALYLSSFDPRITGLSGTSDEIAAAMAAYRVSAHKVPLNSGGYTMDHSAAVYMLDEEGKLVGTISRRDTEAAMRAKLRHLLDSAAG
jgi:protein SCO1/2